SGPITALRLRSRAGGRSHRRSGLLSTCLGRRFTAALTRLTRVQATGSSQSFRLEWRPPQRVTPNMTAAVLELSFASPGPVVRSPQVQEPRSTGRARPADTAPFMHFTAIEH